jgi:pimeloyl-ACP methyl ester carboxylesterase
MTRDEIAMTIGGAATVSRRPSARPRPHAGYVSNLLAGLRARFGADARETSVRSEMSYVETPNQYVVVEGLRLAYRSLGSDSRKPPLVLFQHFTGTLDDWDSAFIDEMAKYRRLVILGNPGIGASEGPAPDSVAAMARLAAGFIETLQLGVVDVLGFSIGGSVAQLLVQAKPGLVRKLILVGAGPQGGEGIANLLDVVGAGISRAGERKVDAKVELFFTQSPRGRAAGEAYAARIANHRVDAEPPASQEAIDAQAKALITWGLSPPDYEALAQIRHPVLIVNGSHDLIVPTINSYVLYQHLPNAYLILYPDSGHGSLFQHRESFVAQTNMFLDAAT